jgi:hypothetical protein
MAGVAMQLSPMSLRPSSSKVRPAFTTRTSPPSAGTKTFPSLASRDAAWVPFVQSRAQYAQSTQRRFRRWLGNRRIEVAPLYGPLIQQALQDWGRHTLYLALDTSMLWNQYCLIRLSVVYRGRAVPLVWEVIEHGSSSVTHAAYEALLETVPALLRIV